MNSDFCLPNPNIIPTPLILKYFKLPQNTNPNISSIFNTHLLISIFLSLFSKHKTK